MKKALFFAAALSVALLSTVASQCIFKKVSYYYVPADAESCSTNQTGSVRLVWGLGPWEGNLQICLNGVWGWVCQNSFSNIDARVVCRQLGYTTTGMMNRC